MPITEIFRAAATERNRNALNLLTNAGITSQQTSVERASGFRNTQKHASLSRHVVAVIAFTLAGLTLPTGSSEFEARVAL